MAGIGFQLKKLLSDETYAGSAKGYLYAAFISSGPWLISVICLALLQVLSARFLKADEANLFRAIVVYCYAFSLITTGSLQMVATRYLSDKLYGKELEPIVPSFAAMLSVSVTVHAVAGFLFFRSASPSPFIQLGSVVLFVSVSSIWLAMVYLSACKDYDAIVASFAVGALVSFGGSIVAGMRLGLPGYLWGYVAGQFLTLLLLVARVLAEFGGAETLDFDVFGYFRKFPELPLIGLFYNLGIWIDKLIFWYAGPGERVAGHLYAYPIYGGSLFLAYLTIVPSLAYFLVKVETSFYEHYVSYFKTIISGAGLRAIESRRDEMGAALRESIGGILKVQATVSIVAIVFAPYVVQALGLLWIQMPILRVCILASFLQALLLMLVVLLLYFDCRREVLILTLIFTALNGVLTYFSIRAGFAFFGYGYAAACMVPLLVGLVMLDRRILHLEFHTFVKQPILPYQSQSANVEE